MIELASQGSNIRFVAQGLTKESGSLLAFLQKETKAEKYERFSACAAYASYRGVLLTRSLLSDLKSAHYRWLIGLDDTLTDPRALMVAMETKGAETRVAELRIKKPKRRFHPKAYLLDCPAGGATLIVGSCNLTEAALKNNCEVYAAYCARKADAADQLRGSWDSLWKMGEPATEETVRDYDNKYQQSPWHEPVVEEEAPSQKPQKPPPHVVKAINETVANSKLAWIVLGKNTGGGNQLDIVKDLGSFLGLPPHPEEGDDCYLSIETSLGKKQYQLTFTKGMWRFMNLQQGFPEALRPDLKQASPYVLVLERQNGVRVTRMRIIPEADKEAIEMIEHSIDLGFAHESKPGPSGRLYGWF